LRKRDLLMQQTACTKHDPIELIRIGDLGPLNVRLDTVLLRVAWMNAVPNKEAAKPQSFEFARLWPIADISFCTASVRF
jgi:hypothetical protein